MPTLAIASALLVLYMGFAVCSGAAADNFGKYLTEYDKRQAKKGEERVSLKNIITSPPKRGTYGFVGLNIGGKAEGVAGEFR